MGGSNSLHELEVLVVDCQTTGANPTRGGLLEVGWMRTSAALKPDAAKVVGRLVTLPAEMTMSPRIAKITGITRAELVSSVAPGEVWAELVEAALGVDHDHDHDHGSGSVPTVIHFARFELPFLHHLHRQCAPERDFPFAVLCTHEITRRVLPGLPRKGLRAVAGYLGMSVSELRRSAEHVSATGYVWRQLVALLHDRYRIETLGDLDDWLSRSPPRPRQHKTYPMPRARRLALPDQPGVYRMLRKNGDLLYVGKATSLRQRVNSYFTQHARVCDRTLEMLSQARDLEVTVTESALEAALLESDEIKRAQPPYNVALREGEREMWFCTPRLDDLAPTPNRRRRWGPFPSAVAVAAAAELCDLLRGEPPDPDPIPLGPGPLLVAPTSLVPWMDMAAHLPAGLARFRDRHRDPLARPALPAALCAIGTASWRERLERGDQDSDPDSDPDPGRWDPEDVADVLDAVCTRFAHHLRRSAWLQKLSESTLAWGDPTRGPLRLLVLHRGQIADRGRIATRAELPVPPGHHRHHRHRDLDLATYDRLRVLTTELRRLVHGCPEVALRLGPSRSYDRAGLGRILVWL